MCRRSGREMINEQGLERFFDEIFLRRILWDGSIDIDIFREKNFVPHNIFYQ